MPKQELLVPVRSVPAPRVDSASVVAPRFQSPGLIGGALTRVIAPHEEKAFRAAAERAKAEADCTDAETKVLEACERRQRVVARLQELPEQLQTEWATRRAERAEALRQAQHKFEIGEIRRMTENALAEAALVDAQQALRGQRRYGHTTYELAWRKKQAEMMEIELDAAERRAILQQHVKEFGARNVADEIAALPPDEFLDDALHERREHLRARGLDTSRIDAVIERRKEHVFR